MKDVQLELMLEWTLEWLEDSGNDNERDEENDSEDKSIDIGEETNVPEMLHDWWNNMLGVVPYQDHYWDWLDNSDWYMGWSKEICYMIMENIEVCQSTI